ncbi:MAG: class III poly(R)-hydroxyalkanoic acid synthase subunit PhaE [Chromatiales bacterium]
MSDKPSAALWGEQWMNAQRAYWNAWTALNRVNPDPRTPAAAENPWSAAVDNWWKSVGGSLSGDSRIFFNRVIEQSKVFFSMAQQMSEFLRAVSEGSAANIKWQEILQGQIDTMKASLSMAPPSEWTDSLRGVMAFYELPLDTWRRTMSGATTLPGDFLENVRSAVWESAGDKVHESVDKFLSVPGLGYTREGQEQIQQMARLVLDYQKAMQDYADAHGRLGAETLDRFYKKIVALTEKGGTITTLRQLYDLWVDCSEEAYGEFVMSPGFQEIYGRMVNALMRVKHQARTLVDEALGAMNMPTRREMNTVLKRQQELRREIRAVRGGDGGSPPRRGRRQDEDTRELDALRKEVAGLRDEMAVMQTATATVGESRQAAGDARVATEQKPATPAGSKREAATPPARLARMKPAKRERRPAKAVRGRAVQGAAAWDISSIAPQGRRARGTARRRVAGFKR